MKENILYLDIKYDGMKGQDGITIVKTYSDPDRMNLIKKEKTYGPIKRPTKKDFRYITGIKEGR